MTDHAKPAAKPARPHFSSGPCAKRPGWSPEVLSNAFLGRSHRAKEGKARLKLAIDKTRQLLELPEDYVCGIVPGSDTGAFEMAMWSLLGERGVDALAWESFGKGWVTDILKQLKLTDVRVHEADYGFLPDLGKVDFDRDVVFTWNGTTSGVRVPDGNWIPADRTGLTSGRRHLGRLRPGDRLEQGRCRDVLLAKGARRRGCTWHAYSEPARSEAARNLFASLAAAEGVPPDQGWKDHHWRFSKARRSTRRPCFVSRTTSIRWHGRRALAG